MIGFNSKDVTVVNIGCLVEIQDFTVDYLTELILNAIKIKELQENAKIFTKMIARSSGISKALEIMKTNCLKKYDNSKMVKVMEYLPIFENEFESLGSMALKRSKKNEKVSFTQ